MYSKTSVTGMDHGQQSKLYVKLIASNACMSQFHLLFLSPFFFFFLWMFPNLNLFFFYYK